MSNDIVQYNIIRWSRADCRMPPWGDQNTTQEDSNNIQREIERERKKQYRAISTNAAKHIYIAPMEMKIRTANASQMIPFFSQKHTM